MTVAESIAQAQQRLRDIAARQELLARRVRTIQGKLVDELTDSAERILTKPSAADSLLVQWAQRQLVVTVGQWATDILAVGEANGLYFRALDTGLKDYAAVQRHATSLLLDRFGLSASGEVANGGFFDLFIKDTTLRSQVKQLAWRSKSSGVGLVKFKQQVRTLVGGNPGAEAGGTGTASTGLVERHFNTFAYDTYQQADAATQDYYAVQLKLPAALYLGGEIKTTRKFCHERQGKVFTRDEIAGWIKLNFAGKTPDYNPFTDRGGYNCRHHYHYITARMAATRRDDLEVRGGQLYVKGSDTPIDVTSASQTQPAPMPAAEVQASE